MGQPMTQIDNDECSPLLVNHRSYGSSKKAPSVTEVSVDGSDVTLEGYDDVNSPFLLDLTVFQFWLILGPILLQYFVAMFDSFLMVSSHPVITSEFNASNSASWLSTAFMLTSAALQPIFGRMSDLFGRKPVYLTALVIFALGTAICAAARNIGDFIAGRAICGLGAGAIISLGNIMVNDLVKLQYRGTYQAYINLLYGGGAAAGAAFGGFLCDQIGWRPTFGLQVPVVVVVFVMAYYTIPRQLGLKVTEEAKHWTQVMKDFDVPGSVLLFISVACFILTLNLGGNIYEWTDPVIISAVTISVITGAMLVFVEKNAEKPILPLRLIAEAPRSNLLFSNMFAMIGSNHILFNAPIFFQVIYGDSPTTAGLRISLPALCTTVCGVATGFFLTYTGRLKAPQVIGAGCMLVGGFMTAVMWESTPQWLATISITPPYAGQGFMFPATILGLLATSSQDDQAVVMTTLILFRNLGIVLGVAISSLVLQNALVHYLELFITGPNKVEIIEKVRTSVRAVSELTGDEKYQAIAAYSSALKLTFVSGLIFFIVVFFLLAPIRLPKLGEQKSVNDGDEDEV